MRLRVSEVASQVGYSDSGYFSVSFRRIMGVSPNTYRAQLTEEMPDLPKIQPLEEESGKETNQKD